METVKEDIKELKIGLQDAVSRIAKLEQAAQERALDTKPIWERALAEIASVRFELVEIKSDIKAIKDDIKEIKTDITVIKAEQAEMKLDIAAIKAEQAEMKIIIAAIKAEQAEMKIDIAAIKAEQAEMKLDILSIKAELTDTKNAMQDGFVLLDKFGEINDDMVNLRVNQKWLRRKLEGLSPKTQ